ncbi:MAG: DUF58 domain-containing protein [Clostridiaceae bacterium]|nr:DUF58 domain-containing protein [Clostridiaceae bacterium]
MEVLFVLAFISIFIALQSWIYRVYALKNLSARIGFSKNIAQCGETVLIEEMIRNEKALPLPMLVLKFEAPRPLIFEDMTNTSLSDYHYREDLLSLGAWKAHTRQIPVKCKKRGYYSFKRFSLTTSDLMLLVKIVYALECDATLTVFPKQIKSIDFEIMLMSFIDERTVKKYLIEDPFAFNGTREYLPTDRMSAVNWGATSRCDELMVNTYCSSVHSEISILVNVEPYTNDRREDCIEKAISIAYSTALVLTQRHFEVAVYCNSRDVLTESDIRINRGSGPKHAEKIGYHLARIDLSRGCGDFDNLLEDVTRSRRDLSAIIISANTVNSLQRQLIRRHQNGFDFIWIVPLNIYDPEPVILDALKPLTKFWRHRFDG